MEIPDSVIQAVRAATIEHLGDLEAAVPAAVDAVRALPDFRSVSAALVNHAIQGLVYRERGSLNTQVAREAAYVGPPKVNVATSEAVQRVAGSVFNLALGGKRLGDLTGLELDEVATSEGDKARGHLVNVALVRWCRGKVGDNVLVRRAVKEADLKRVYARLQRQHEQALERAA